MAGWDRDVCERLVAGDESALGELYDQFSSLVYGLAARVTRDWAAAEDITQDVFVRVWEDP
jgi:DNA-directed RNA polymerase specialized sigma24 family protein